MATNIFRNGDNAFSPCHDRIISMLQSALKVIGRMNGYASRVKYFAFALSYSQIDKLLREGPNPTMFRPSQASPLSVSPHIAIGWDIKANSGPLYVPNANAFDQNLPGYQTDSWWTSGNAYSGNGAPHEPGFGPQ